MDIQLEEWRELAAAGREERAGASEETSTPREEGSSFSPPDKSLGSGRKLGESWKQRRKTKYVLYDVKDQQLPHSQTNTIPLLSVSFKE